MLLKSGMFEKLKQLSQKLQDDEVTRFAASLSYYTALSFAPILILFVIVSSGLSPTLKGDLEKQIASLVGHNAGELVHTVLESSQARPDLTSLAGLVGGLTLLLSASLIFGELRAAMNRIFDCQKVSDPTMTYFQSFLQFLRERVLHVGMVLGFTLMIIVSLITSSLIYGTLIFNDHWLAAAINILISLGFYSISFAVMIRYLPDDKQSWRTAFQGGAVIGVMFLIGKEVISLYLSSSDIGSAYGAVGSIVVLLVWVYYSSIIILVGTEASRFLLNNKRG